MKIFLKISLFLLLGGAPLAHAAIAVDNNAKNHCASCSSLTYSLTVGAAGVDRLLVVGVVLGQGVGFYSTGITVSSVTYGGSSLTQIGTYLNQSISNPPQTDQSRVDQWYVVAPPTGAHNVVVTLSGGTPSSLLSGATSLTGVNQGNPIRQYAAADATQTGGNATVSVSSQTNDLVLDTVCAGTSIGTASQTGQYLSNVNSGTSCNNIGGSTQAGAATSTTMTWTGMNGVADDIWVDFASSIEADFTYVHSSVIGGNSKIGGVSTVN